MLKRLEAASTPIMTNGRAPVISWAARARTLSIALDLSGITFKSKLGIVLPRSTDLQVEGQHVDKDELRAGDLVFFKTGRMLRHVGEYPEDGRFLHASSKLGVAISHLNESYWKSAYWKAKRL